MKNIAVIGAGTMGNGITHVFAQCGYQVNLIDVSSQALEKGMATITKNLDRQVAKEKISVSDKETALSKISTFQTIEDGVSGFLAKTTDTADIVDAITRAINYPNPNTISQNARLLIGENFSLDSFQKKEMSIVNDLVGTHD